MNTGTWGASVRIMCTSQLSLRSEGVAELGTCCCDTWTSLGVKVGRNNEFRCGGGVIGRSGDARVDGAIGGNAIGGNASGRSSWT